jgi:hypothetical protein
MVATIQLRGALTLGTDWSGCTADHSPPCSSEGKNQWSDTSIVSYNCVVCATTNLPSLFISGSARFEVPTEAVLKVQIFCGVTPCRLVYIFTVVLEDRIKFNFSVKQSKKREEGCTMIVRNVGKALPYDTASLARRPDS